MGPLERAAARREYQARYGAAHREKFREYERKYQREHREEILARRRECYRRNIERNKARYRKNRKRIAAYYLANRERMLAYHRKYCRDHPKETRERRLRWQQRQAALEVMGQMRSLAIQLQHALKGRKPMDTVAEVASFQVMEEALQKVAAMSDPEELRRMILENLSNLVQNFVQLAALVKRCSELGVDLSDIRIPILPYLMRLACGQLLPEVLVQFHSRPAHLRRISALPLTDQRKIIHGEPCTLMLPNGDHRAVPATFLSGPELAQVFGPDGIRNDAEQATYLREKTQRRRPLTPGDVQMDYQHGRVHIIGDKWLDAEELSHLVSLLVAHGTRNRRTGS